MTHAYWFATRASGVVSLVLLTLVVALGIAGSLRLRSERWPRFLVTGLHRNLTLLTLVFLTGHIVTTVLDSFTPIGLRDAFLPFLASYRPIWLGLGAVAFDLLLALTVTSLLRARIGYRTWRSLHWLAYAAWPVALVHGLGTGSDARFGWMQALTVGCVLLVVAAVARRLSMTTTTPARRILGASAAACVLLAGGIWYVDGPGAKGWAARAGTPTALLPHLTKTVASVAASSPRQSVDLPAAPFTTQLNGTIASVVEPASGIARIDIRARTSGAVNGRLWIRLQGVPLDDDGGVAMRSSGVAFGPAAAPNEYLGRITALQGTELALSLHNAHGREIALDVLLNVDQATRRVTGTLRAVE
jgi:sulfoxide reductase heme-binding subunit YedZ